MQLPRYTVHAIIALTKTRSGGNGCSFCDERGRKIQQVHHNWEYLQRKTNNGFQVSKWTFRKTRSLDRARASVCAKHLSKLTNDISPTCLAIIVSLSAHQQSKSQIYTASPCLHLPSQCRGQNKNKLYHKEIVTNRKHQHSVTAGKIIFIRNRDRKRSDLVNQTRGRGQHQLGRTYD